ncbi:MAG: hypothetical protein A3G83_10405 [Betaproteobacteria bacterium RIFCSPLOWO2_12_FULL_68_20]|nr:MAG: hypothetical protein A3G83_10405 [Betaproteobacteria bacterium RIFCSPLOWO2_12_FULL_68_20]
MKQAAYKPVRGLARGLSVLAALNARAPGAWPLEELADELSLHRTTVKRLLETLVKEGWVTVLPMSRRYAVTSQVRALARGARDQDLVVVKAAPLLAEFTGDSHWPVIVATPDAEALVVRASTLRISAFVSRRDDVGLRLPLGETASGRAYRVARDEGAARLVYHDGTWSGAPGTAAISIGIGSGAQTLGALTMIFPSRRVRAREAAARYGERLAALATRLASS